MNRGFPGRSDGKESACNGGDLSSIPGSGRSTPVFLPEESHGQRSLVGYSPWGRKELDTTERLTLYFFIAWSNGFFCIPAFQVKGAHSRRL